MLDFYGDILTEKQKDVLELYYNEDLSLAEIAEHQLISRQGVRDSIKRGEETLLELEDKLHMAKKLTDLSHLLDNIKEVCEKIYDESSTYNFSKNIIEESKEVLELIEQNRNLLE